MPDPYDAPRVRRAFELAAEGKYSLRAILNIVIEEGLRSRVDKPLSVSALWTVLRNPFYVGQIRFHDRNLNGAHEPLVSSHTFNRLKARRKKTED